MKKEILISQSEAAEKAGVSRQAIGKMKHSGNYNIYGKGSIKVNTNCKDWHDYVESQKDDKKIEPQPVTNTVKKKSVVKSKSKPQGKVSKKKSVKKSKSKIEPVELKTEKENKSGYKKEFALTGGFDPGSFTPTTPSQLKSLTDVVVKNIEMQLKLGTLITRDVLEPYLDIISQVIQSSFVDLSRKVSGDICEVVERIGMEKEVEKIISPMVVKGIEEIKKACDRARKVK